MRILLDECLPKKLKSEFTGHTIFTVQEKGWAGTKNGELLRRAENEFDVWITTDRNIEYQQNLSNFDIAVIVLVAPRNQLEYLLPLIPQLPAVGVLTQIWFPIRGNQICLNFTFATCIPNRTGFYTETLRTSKTS